MYLAVVLDVYSRKVVGWAFGQQQTAELVIAALNMALITRKPQGVIHHSDQGSQYTSVDFGKRCKEMGVRPSMGSVGDAYDNAMAESFFASLECELIDRRSWKSFAEAFVPAARVVPSLDPGEDGHARLGEGLPTASVDELALKACEEALSHGGVVGVAHAARGRPNAHLFAASAEVHAGVLGEFNESSQHVLTGGVDEAEEVEVRSIAEAKAAFARQAAGNASDRAMAVLEGDRAMTLQRGRGRDGRRVAGCGQPLVPTIRRYASVQSRAIRS